MSDRNPVFRSGQSNPSESSVTMEDRDVLRRMERERRSQEVQQEETQYDRIAPLFSEPFKRIRGDELSSRIQNMLGNYEDGSDEFPVACFLELDGLPALGPRALGLPALGLPALGLPALGLPALGLPPLGLPPLGLPPLGPPPLGLPPLGLPPLGLPPLGLPPLGLPALGPPVLPLSPLPASDSSSSPDLSIHRPDVPPLTLNLPCKLANAKKPTAYVRPMDGQDQVTSDSPRLKASPDRLQDLKESSEPSLPPQRSVDASVDSVRVQVVSGKRAEDILQEMISWPPLLMSICTPSSAEPPKVPNTNEEPHGFTALKAHESSDGIQLEPQVASGSSSDSDSSSDTDSENNRSPDTPAAHEPSNTQTQKGSDWHLGRWLERKEDQHQQSTGSPCDVIKPSSHDPAGRTEAAGQQGCYSNPSDSRRVANGRQNVGNTCKRGNLPLGSKCVEIPQHDENASTRRSKHKREKTSRETEQEKTTATEDNNISKQTCRKPPLLVKIQLNLLSRIPQEPKAAQHRTGLTLPRIPQEPKAAQHRTGLTLPRILQEPKAAQHRTGLTLPRIPQEPKAAQHRNGLTLPRIPQEPKADRHQTGLTLPRIPQEPKAAQHRNGLTLPRIPQEPKAARHQTGLTTPCKRTAESDEKFPKKKQNLDVEGKKLFSSQQSLHQSEASRSSETTMMKKRKKSTKHGSGVPQEPQRDAGHKRRSDNQLRKAEPHGKKHCKSRSIFTEELRPPTAEAHRQRSVEDHMKEAKKLKHKADATLDKMAKALCYLEAALAFVESAIAMETEPETPKSAYTMFSETLDLIRFILKLKNYTDPSATARERDFFILCLRCQSLLQMAMFRYRRDSALRYSRTLADHFRSSSWSASPSMSKSSVVSPVNSGSGSLVVPQHIQQAAASYVSITTLFLSAHETWEQADDLMLSGSGLLRELDSSVAPLSLTASMISLVAYIRLGLHRIRCDTQNQDQL